jgi:Plasma-membrane choline transporter
MEVAAGSGEDDGYVKGVVLEPSYNDVWFAAAFAVIVLFTLGAGIFLGIPAVSSDAAATNTNGTATNNNHVDDNDTGGDPGLLFCGVQLLLGAAWSVLALQFVLRGCLKNPAQMVQVAYFAAPILFALSTLVRFALGTLSEVWVQLELFWALLLVAGWRALRKFLPFAAATLQVSAVWLLATLGVGSLFDDDDDNKSNTDDGLPLPFGKFLACVVLFSLLWGLQVIKNVVRFTNSGAVGTWWFMPSHEHDGKSAVKGLLSKGVNLQLWKRLHGVALHHDRRDPRCNPSLQRPPVVARVHCGVPAELPPCVARNVQQLRHRVCGFVQLGLPDGRESKSFTSSSTSDGSPSSTILSSIAHCSCASSPPRLSPACRAWRRLPPLAGANRPPPPPPLPARTAPRAALS